MCHLHFQSRQNSQNNVCRNQFEQSENHTGVGGRRVKLTGTLQSHPPFSHLFASVEVWILT